MNENATALFYNFTDQPFTGYWDGRPHTFKPGEKFMMSASLAEHYAKHLTNRILFERGQITYMSPKKPLEVPIFMDVFNMACIYSDTAENPSPTDADIQINNFKEPKETKKVKTSVDNKPPQVLKVPKDDDDDFEDVK